MSASTPSGPTLRELAIAGSGLIPLWEPRSAGLQLLASGACYMACSATCFLIADPDEPNAFPRAILVLLGLALGTRCFVNGVQMSAW